METERLQQELQAQEAVWQADREFAARLSDSNRAILSDREYAEELQAEIEREAAVEFPFILPTTGYGVQRSKSGSMYGESPIDRVRNGTQQSHLRASNDREFAQSLHEEEKKMLAREAEKARSEISAWQKKTKQGADRDHRRSGIFPPKPHASPQGRTTHPNQAQAPQGSQAAQKTKPVTNDLGDERECDLCTDTFTKSQLIRPCEHFYCRGCLAGKAILQSAQGAPWRRLTAEFPRIVSACDER